MGRFALLAVAGLMIAGRAAAQTTPAVPDAPPLPAEALPDPNDQRDTLTIGVGGAVVPDFEGSGDYKLIPAAAARGRYKGIGFSTRGAALAIDLIPRGSGRLSISAGPLVGVRLNRNSSVKDPIVNLLPRRRRAIEVGAFAELNYHGLTNPYDSLGARIEVVHDIGGAHRSTLISPSVDFSTPVSKRTFVGISAGLDYAPSRYARYYFGVTPTDSLTSGLPSFNPRGGLKDWKASLFALQSITGNLLHGLGIGGAVGYSRLVGDFKRSPIVAERGKAGQWFGALGLAYTW